MAGGHRTRRARAVTRTEGPAGKGLFGVRWMEPRLPPPPANPQEGHRRRTDRPPTHTSRRRGPGRLRLGWHIQWDFTFTHCFKFSLDPVPVCPIYSHLLSLPAARRNTRDLEGGIKVPGAETRKT